MTFLVERLADLRRHLDHLGMLRPKVQHAAQLETDLSLHNDVLFSLLARIIHEMCSETSPSRFLVGLDGRGHPEATLSTVVALEAGS